MKTYILTISSIMVILFSFHQEETKVYICKGKGSKRYHLIKTCRGLSHCSTDTFEVPLKKAKKMGRTLCGWED